MKYALYLVPLLLLFPLTPAPAKEAPPETMESILARIKAPQFPAKDFEITKYGAQAGEADSSAAIIKAIDECNKAGGGRVVIPAGVFSTGPVHLKSNVNLHISEGATLKFLPDFARYLPQVLTRFEGMELMGYSPLIYALEQENIAITGPGTLDGGATDETWWDWNNKSKGNVKQKAARSKLNDMVEKNVPVAERVFGEGSYLRPNFIQPYRCNNVLIEGVHIIQSPMWELNPVLCTNVTVRKVNIKSLGPNNDGCDPESCRDVLIEDCVFETGDDCIAIKSGRNNDGRRVGVAAENTVIRNCTMKDGHGGVTIGSEISGGCRYVFVENCEMDSPELDRALRIKSNAQRGGVVEHVVFKNIKIGRVAKAVLSVELDYEEGAKGEHPPVVRDILLENVTSEASPRVVYIHGIPQSTVEDIRLVNCTFRGVKNEDDVKDAKPPTMTNVKIESTKKAKATPTP